MATFALIKGSHFGLHESELLELLALAPALVEKKDLPSEIKFKTTAKVEKGTKRINMQTVISF